MSMHEKFMRRCIELAERGRGYVSPNPMVGSLIVRNNTIIAEGWHQEFGQAHAEVNAINSLDGQEDFSGCTLYVNLEPCCTHGKTPPCSDLIIEKGISNVVIGCKDQNPKVSGKGIEQLKKAGIKVTEGILKEECRELNQDFFSQFSSALPYVIIKWAQSADGYIAGENGKPVHFTNKYSDMMVHKLRSEVDGILVGANTIRNDNPQLTTRYWNGTSPRKIILSGSGNIPEESGVLKDPDLLIISNSSSDSLRGKKNYYLMDGGLKGALDWLLKHGVQRILVEGGTETINYFLNEGNWNECWVFENGDEIGKGIPAPELPRGKKMIRNVRNNQLFIIVNTLSN